MSEMVVFWQGIQPKVVGSALQDKGPVHDSRHQRIKPNRTTMHKSHSQKPALEGLGPP
ncbi:hypothetical protein [Hoeflea alexandrii]